MMAGNGLRLACRLARRPALRLLLGSRLLPSVSMKRDDSIFTKYREPPNGFLFNEKPLKPGEKRKWEDWEAIWYTGWGVSFFIFVIGAIYRPESEELKDAKAEAERRLAELDAADAAEAEESKNGGVVLQTLASDIDDGDL